MARPPASAGRKRKRGIEMAPWRQFYRCRLAREGNRLQNSRLLDVADLAVREGDLHVLVHVDLLRPEIDDLVGFPVDRFHLGDGLSQGDCDRPRRTGRSVRCDGRRRTWGSIRCSRDRGRGYGIGLDRRRGNRGRRSLNSRQNIIRVGVDRHLVALGDYHVFAVHE